MRELLFVNEPVWSSSVFHSCVLFQRLGGVTQSEREMITCLIYWSEYVVKWLWVWTRHRRGEKRPPAASAEAAHVACQSSVHALDFNGRVPNHSAARCSLSRSLRPETWARGGWSPHALCWSRTTDTCAKKNKRTLVKAEVLIQLVHCSQSEKVQALKWTQSMKVKSFCAKTAERHLFSTTVSSSVVLVLLRLFCHFCQ